MCIIPSLYAQDIIVKAPCDFLLLNYFDTLQTTHTCEQCQTFCFLPLDLKVTLVWINTADPDDRVT